MINKDSDFYIINNNYRKIKWLHFNSKNNKKDSENFQDLGLGFVIVKWIKKEVPGNNDNKNNNIVNLSTIEIKYNKNILSINNPNKKLW